MPASLWYVRRPPLSTVTVTVTVTVTCHCHRYPLVEQKPKEKEEEEEKKETPPNNLKKQSISNLQHNIRSLYNLSHATLRSTTNDQRPNQLFALGQLFFYSYDVDRTDEISYAIANIRLL